MNSFTSGTNHATFARDFDRDGFATPIDVLSADEIGDLYQRLKDFEATRAGGLPKALNAKVHLLFPWLWDLVVDPRIVTPVRAILGPDVLCWAASFFDKPPGTRAEVPWHQDGTYWGLTEPRALTAWIAFTPSTSANGGMRVVPGTHRAALPHHRTDNRNSMLPAREQVSSDVPDDQIVDIDLQPGQMSLHHVMTLHGSPPNVSDAPRVGFAVRYIAGDLRQASGQRSSASLVCGKDHDTFQLESRPDSDLDPEAVKRYYASLRTMARTVFPERNSNTPASR